MTTTYRWTLLGELQQMDYSDATPDVSFTWNAHNGSQATMTDTLGTHTYAVRTDGLLESETISTADGAAVIDPGWDAYRRRQTLVASYAGAATGQETRHYSTQGRLTYLVSDGRTTEYRYHPSTNRVQKRLSWSGAYPAALTQVAETVETLDTMNRIWVMTNRRSDAMGAPVFSSHTYTFDSANRRDLAVREDGTRWDYDYNDRSEVTAAKRQLGNGTLLAGMESTYVYDAIGNRTSSSSGGGPAVASGTPANVSRSVSYESNALNQYTKLEQSARSFDVAGRYVYDPAASGSSPQVNGIAPWEQTISSGAGGTQLKHFRTSLTAAASGDATGNYENVNVSTAAGTVLEYSGLKWVPKTIVQPTYDFDGNLLTDGRWTYTWDAENRLKSISHNGSVNPYVPGLLVEFRYDGLSRRVEKKVSTINGSVWIEQLRERTLYDGWNPIGTWRLQPPDAGHSNPWWKLHQHYVWGPDVSGTSQGAGGVGGLAMIIGGSGGNWFPCYDGNGNITALVDALPNGALATQYDYDAFGNPVRMSGSAARLNPFRFSTKFTDDETELVYYGYRYYSPAMGRWINRDPIKEDGGANIYTCSMNNAANLIDKLGMQAQAVAGATKARAGLRIMDNNINNPEADVELKQAPGIGWQRGASHTCKDGPCPITFTVNDGMQGQLKQAKTIYPAARASFSINVGDGCEKTRLRILQFVRSINLDGTAKGGVHEPPAPTRYQHRRGGNGWAVDTFDQKFLNTGENGRLNPGSRDGSPYYSDTIFGRMDNNGSGSMTDTPGLHPNSTYGWEFATCIICEGKDKTTGGPGRAATEQVSSKILGCAHWAIIPVDGSGVLYPIAGPRFTCGGPDYQANTAEGFSGALSKWNSMHGNLKVPGPKGGWQDRGSFERQSNVWPPNIIQ